MSQLRRSSIIAGVAIGVMAVLAPLGLMIALPAGHTAVAAIVAVGIAALDVVVGIALYPVLAPGGTLLAQCACALRVAYGAVFASAAGFLLAPAQVERFHAAWDAALLVFGLHLVLVGVALVRARSAPTVIGALVIVAGAGYAVDFFLVVLAPSPPLTVSEFTFVGEVVLLVWLLGWSGRTRAAATRRERASALSGR